ncbi:hypothetical protein ACJX0J_008921, partial [Zea mays]
MKVEMEIIIYHNKYDNYFIPTDNCPIKIYIPLFRLYLIVFMYANPVLQICMGMQGIYWQGWNFMWRVVQMTDSQYGKIIIPLTKFD